MSNTRESKVSIRLDVILAPALKAFADPKYEQGQEFASRLLKYSNGFLNNLKIPASLSLSVKPRADDQRLIGSPFRIFLGGRRCRITLPVAVAESVRASELAVQIANVIYRNVELVFDNALSQKIWQGWCADVLGTEPRPAPQGFLELLMCMVRRGFSIENCRNLCEAFQQEEQGNWRGDQCFERAVVNSDSIAVRVLLDRVGDSLSPALTRSLEDLFDALQVRLFDELGISLPRIEIQLADDLSEGEFSLQMNDVRLPPIKGLRQDQFLVNATSETLSALKVTGEDAVHPENGSKTAIVEDKKGALKKCRDAGMQIWYPTDFIAFSLGAELRRNAANFLTNEAVEYGMELMRQTSPDLVDAVTDRFHLETVTALLRSLLHEGISIKNLRGIVESLLSIQGTTSVDHNKYLVFYPDPPHLCPVASEKQLENLEISDLLNRVRMSLAGYVSNKYASSGNPLVCYTMDPRIEERISNIDKQPLQEAETTRLINAIWDKTATHNVPGSGPLIVTTIFARKKLRELIEKEFPQLVVLCYQELLPSLRIQTVAQISWE